MPTSVCHPQALFCTLAIQPSANTMRAASSIEAYLFVDAVVDAAVVRVRATADVYLGNSQLVKYSCTTFGCSLAEGMLVRAGSL